MVCVSIKLTEKEIHDITLGILSKMYMDYNCLQENLIKDIYLKKYFETFEYVKENYHKFEK